MKIPVLLQSARFQNYAAFSVQGAGRRQWPSLVKHCNEAIEALVVPEWAGLKALHAAFDVDDLDD